MKEVGIIMGNGHLVNAYAQIPHIRGEVTVMCTLFFRNELESVWIYEYKIGKSNSKKKQITRAGCKLRQSNEYGICTHCNPQGETIDEVWTEGRRFHKMIY